MENLNRYLIPVVVVLQVVIIFMLRPSSADNSENDRARVEYNQQIAKYQQEMQQYRDRVSTWEENMKEYQEKLRACESKL